MSISHFYFSIHTPSTSTSSPLPSSLLFFIISLFLLFPVFPCPGNVSYRRSGLIQKVAFLSQVLTKWAFWYKKEGGGARGQNSNLPLYLPSFSSFALYLFSLLSLLSISSLFSSCSLVPCLFSPFFLSSTSFFPCPLSRLSSLYAFNFFDTFFSRSLPLLSLLKPYFSPLSSFFLSLLLIFFF